MNALNLLRYATSRGTPFSSHLVPATMTDLFILAGRGFISVVPKSHGRTHFQVTQLGIAEYERLEDAAYSSALIRK